MPSWSSSCPLHNNQVTTQHPYRSMCPTPSSLQVWALTRIAVEPLCPGFIPTKDSIFRSGEKDPTNVQFNAVIVRQPKRDYVIFNKWYEPDLLNRKGGWETGQRLITYK